MPGEMSQRDIIKNLNSIIQVYQGIGSGMLYKKLVPAFPPDFTSDITKLFLDSDPIKPGRPMAQRMRPDMGTTLFADVHRVTRNAGRSLCDQVTATAKYHPENTSLAMVAHVANTIYTALDTTYQAGKQVEHSFKQGIRKSLANAGDTNEIAEAQWKTSKDRLLADNPAVQTARAALRNIIILKDPSPKRESLLAEYGRIFPEATEEDLLGAIAFGEKIAVYSFVAKQGFFNLSDNTIHNFLNDIFNPTQSGAKEIAYLCDTMMGEPYNVPSLGIADSDIQKHLAGHSRQVQIYALFEELVLGGVDLNNANAALVALGVGSPAEVKTGKEMAALVGGVAYQLNNSEWKEFAKSLMDAKNTGELQDIITGERGQVVLEGIAGLNASQNPALAKAQSLIADARSRANELDVKVPSAARQVRAQAAARESGGCPMHR